MSPAVNDPLGYLDELREALTTPFIQSLPSPEANLENGIDDVRWESAEKLDDTFPEACENALSVISSLGFCRLFRIALPPDVTSMLSRPLPPELLVPTFVGALRLLHVVTDDARSLPEQFDAAEPPADRSYCTSILHQLMEVWAVFIVVDDEYQNHLCAGHSLRSPFGVWMRRLLDAFAALDDVLQHDEGIRLLSTATELPLLDNWRKMLATPYRESLPWWLDGTLEDAAEATRKLIAGDQSIASSSPRSKRPTVLTLLANRDQEIFLQETQNALAASGGEVFAPEANALLHTTCSIVDEPAVQVRLELRPAENEQRELRVTLIGPMAVVRNYISLTVGFENGRKRDINFQLGCAVTLLMRREVAELATLMLIDRATVPRAVQLD